ncbi:MAG: SAM-dependent methyltransferase, partial [Actinomycetota bacterium]
AGRRLSAWARAAGADRLDESVGTWLFTSADDRGWWGSMWADRVVESAVGRQAVDLGVATAEDVQAWSSGWREWSTLSDGWFVCVHGEVVIHA